MPGWGCRKERNRPFRRCEMRQGTGSRRGVGSIVTRTCPDSGGIREQFACEPPAHYNAPLAKRSGRGQSHCLPTSPSRQETTISGQALTESARGKTTYDWRPVCNPVVRDVR